MPHLHRFAVAALAASLPLAAQQHLTLKRIVFKGTTSYTDAQLERASGLKPGQSFTAADLTAAAQKLMDTGAFKDVDPSLDGPVTGITAVLRLTPADSKDLLPISIDNLVWLDPAQRTAELQRRVPLYGARLPHAGDLGTQVRDALQAMLAEKSVTYQVSLVDQPSTDTAPETLHFRIDSPQIVLQNVRLAGLTAQTAAPLRESLRSVVGKSYDEGAGASLDDQFLAPFRNTGYLDATITNLARTATPEPTGKIGVVVSGTVVPGEPYHVGTLTFAGAPLYTVAQFNSTQALHNGEIASQAALQQSYQPILDAYHDKGYVDARIDTAPVVDKAAHTVNYTLTLDPGSPYTIGALHVDGLTGKPRADVDANWQLTPGSTYNASYLKTFLVKNTALRSLEPYIYTYTSKADPQTHTVDLTLHFFGKDGR